VEFVVAVCFFAGSLAIYFFLLSNKNRAAVSNEGIDIRVDDSLSPSLLVVEKAKPRWQSGACLAAATARTAKFREYMLKEGYKQLEI
jgi:hypothetical protein